MNSNNNGIESIAVIGMACRVPGADNVNQFWSNLVDGVESVRFCSKAEQAASGVPQGDLQDPDFVPVTAVLPEPEYFDESVFRMSAAEAELRDPQHRIFLELSHTALEDAGYDASRYPGYIGVYAGSGEDAYQWLNVRRNRAAFSRAGAVGMAVHSHPDYVATLASYQLGLRGPSMTVHSACSTSLVAVHLACEALRNRECDMSLAGGVNLDLPIGRGYVYLDGGVHSRDGHCRAFDAAASGTVWGSGGAVAVLKRLEDAVADGDLIRGVLLGNAVNNDGSGKVGFTAPSLQGQAAVVAQALSAAGVNPRTIGYVEAHGTGTALGDPIEVAALSSVFGRTSADVGWCALGSVKTNIGHLGPAAGIVGLLKAVLAAERGVIPPSLNFQSPNPEIEFGKNPFFVNTAPLAWDSGTGPRRAAVSSFGMGGTNAHVVVEQPPPRARKPADPRKWQLIQLSAQTKTALTAAAGALADHMEFAADDEVSDVAYTLQVGRQEMPERLAVTASNRADAVAALRDKRRWLSGTAGRSPRPIVYLFPGQGSQHARMGAGLYASEPIYRDTVDECAAILGQGAAGRGQLADLRRYLTADGEGDEEDLTQTGLAQPALFTVEYALAVLLRSRGLSPSAMIGHSVGEYVAATCAGVFSLADAVRAVAMRGLLMQSLPVGAMLAVQLDEPQLRERLPEALSVAAVNGPGACVVAGLRSDIGRFAETLAAEDVGFRLLRTSHAFHSAMMEPVMPAFLDFVAGLSLSPPAVPYCSNVTGKWVTPEQATDPAYWARHIRETVRFGDCLETAGGKADDSIFLECGPGRQLSGLVRMRRRGDAAVQCLPGPGEDREEDAQTLTAATGRLWAAGCGLEGPSAAVGNRLALPTYAWERRYRWVTPDTGQPDRDEPDDGQADPRNHDWRNRLVVPAWRQLPPLNGTGTAPGRLVILSDDDDVIARTLIARGSEVTVVSRGAAYQRYGPGRYAVRPSSRADYEELFADLAREAGDIPSHMVHCWTVADDPADTAQAAWAAQDDGFFGLLALVQALAVTVPPGDIQVDVVTAGTQAVLGGDLARPEHATVAGAVKTLPLELPWLNARQIDVDPDFAMRAGDGRCGLARVLVNEICQPENFREPAREPLVCLRNGRRWARTFEDCAGTSADPGQPNGEPGFRESGVYVITGGLGGIGITLAEDLATRFKAKLVLISRRDLPPREQWDALDPAGSDFAWARRAIDAIRRMEQAGASVHVISADITDPGRVLALREEVAARYGAVNGIIHAAGVAGGGMGEVKEREAAERVLTPKIAGTLALRDAFGRDELDFVVLCSSVTAIVGGFGQADYCAANAFIDAHAATSHGWNATVVSVNWGAWLDVGMAAETASPSVFRALRQGQRTQPVGHPLLTTQHLGDDAEARWCSGTVRPDTHWVLADHRIGGVSVLPGTAHLEAVRCAFEQCYPQPGPASVAELKDVVFTQPFTVPDGTSAELRVAFVGGAGPGSVDFELSSRAGEVTTVHSRGSAGWVNEDAADVDLGSIRDRCSLGASEGSSLTLSGSGLVTFGPHWRNLRRVYRGASEQLVMLAVADEADAAPWGIQPAVLDEAAASGWFDAAAGFLPFGYGRVTVFRRMPAQVWAHLRYQEPSAGNMVAADLSLYDQAGREVLRVTDLAMRKASAAALEDSLGAAFPVKAAETAGIALGLRERENGIRPADGVTAFRRLVHAEIAPQVVISANRVERMIAESGKVDYESVERELTASRAGRTEAAGGGEASSFTERERSVARILEDLLGRSATTVHDDFFDLGGNSLVAVQFVAFLRKEFGVRVPMRRFFAEPTIASIAALVDEILVARDQADG